MSRQLRVGDKFVALRGTPSGDITAGKTYEVVGVDYADDAYFMDDAGERNFAIAACGHLSPSGYRLVHGPRRVAKCPDSGQFVAVWMYAGKVWSAVYKYTDEGYLLEYNSANDEFVSCTIGLSWMDEYNPEFYVS